MTGRGSKVHKTRVSRSVRAGVVFPVSRVLRYMKQSFLKRRVAVGAPIYLSAVLEYLCAEVMELAGNAAADNKRKVISPRHILLAVANDDELHKLLKGVTISQGGVLPHIPEQLLVKKSAWKKSSTARAQSSSGTARAQSGSGTARAQSSSGTARAQSGKSSKSKKGKTAKTASPSKSSSKTKRAKPVTKVTVLSEKTLFLGQKLTVIQGDLSDLSADAVVHPTNGSFSLSGQCGTSLRQRGGESFEAAVREVSSSSMAVAEAVMSGSGDSLPCGHVIHVHSPSWSSSGSAVADLEKAVKNCLTLADKEKLSTIAFPSIASGSNNFPKHTAAQTILRSIRDYFTSTTSSSISQVYFVLYDMESIGVYTLELSRLDD